MESLLFLCHRLPYPPNKGDKIRSWNFLRHLATRYRIHLGTFIDDPEDEQYRADVARVCADLFTARISPRRRRWKSLYGLLTGEPLSLTYYRDPHLQAWVTETLARVGPRRVFVFSSSMGQYLPPQRPPGSRVVVDFVDVDSAKWRAYAASARWPARLLHQREAELLFAWERRLAEYAQAGLFVSAAEADFFNSLLPRPLSRIAHVDNGVDVDYFKPDPALPAPFSGRAKSLVFTGVMDYQANVDAVTWFADQIWPQVRAAVPDAEFWVVGARPASRVRVLANLPGVRVTGSVPDVRPYLQHATAAVAPLRIARGVQNKVLEALAMDKRVVGTAGAFEGILPGAGGALVTCDEAGEFAAACAEALRFRNPESGRARAHAIRAHAWEVNLRRLETFLED